MCEGGLFHTSLLLKAWKITAFPGSGQRGWLQKAFLGPLPTVPPPGCSACTHPISHLCFAVMVPSLAEFISIPPWGGGAELVGMANE